MIVWQQSLYRPEFYSMSREAAETYNLALVRFYRVLRKKGIFPKSKDLGRWIERDLGRRELHSQSFQAAYQQFFAVWKSYTKALKEWKKSPAKFKNRPKPPYRTKGLQPVRFKSSAIRVEGDTLLLSRVKGAEPIRVRWAAHLPVPKQVLVNYDRDARTWRLNAVIDETLIEMPEYREKLLAAYAPDPDVTASCDPGVNRSAAIGVFVGKKLVRTKLYSGKILKSITRLENRVKAKASTRLSKLKKGSRKHKKITRAHKRVMRRLADRKKDILHKQSRQIVDAMLWHNVRTLFMGDCSGIHDGADAGKRWNQLIQQHPEQVLVKYVTQKFERAGGVVEATSEYRTSKSCPDCSTRNVPKRRVYRCKACGLTADREEVAVINIWKRGKGFKVSQEETIHSCVVGVLTTPHGVRWKPHTVTPTAKPDCRSNPAAAPSAA